VAGPAHDRGVVPEGGQQQRSDQADHEQAVDDMALRTLKKKIMYIVGF
jgi:hypothetical protein